MKDLGGRLAQAPYNTADQAVLRAWVNGPGYDQMLRQVREGLSGYGVGGYGVTSPMRHGYQTMRQTGSDYGYASSPMRQGGLGGALGGAVNGALGTLQGGAQGITGGLQGGAQGIANGMQGLTGGVRLGYPSSSMRQGSLGGTLGGAALGGVAGGALLGPIGAGLGAGLGALGGSRLDYPSSPMRQGNLGGSMIGGGSYTGLEGGATTMRQNGDGSFRVYVNDKPYRAWGHSTVGSMKTGLSDQFGTMADGIMMTHNGRTMADHEGLVSGGMYRAYRS